MTRRLFLPLVALIAAAAPALAIPPVPRPEGEFVINLPDGTQKLLTSYRGKVVCLAFISTTCPHCQHASQVLTQLYKEYGSQGFQPVAVAFNPMAKMLVPDFVRSFGIPFPVGAAESDIVFNYLGISPLERSVVPQLLWIDRNGQIRSQTPAMGDDKMLGEPYWREMITTLLKERASSKTTHHPASTPKTTKAASHAS